MKAIATIYNGLQFRSRLEATWAAFFDLMGWKWEYEPCDFPGWIPDFLLGNYHYVEVKPWRDRKQIIVEEAWEGRDLPLILCGIAPPFTESHLGVSFGWLHGGGDAIAGPLRELKYPDLTHYKMLHAWRQAKNAAQWKAPKRRSA